MIKTESTCDNKKKPPNLRDDGGFFLPNEKKLCRVNLLLSVVVSRAIFHGSSSGSSWGHLHRLWNPWNADVPTARGNQPHCQARVNKTQQQLGFENQRARNCSYWSCHWESWKQSSLQWRGISVRADTTSTTMHAAAPSHCGDVGGLNTLELLQWFKHHCPDSRKVLVMKSGRGWGFRLK